MTFKHPKYLATCVAVVAALTGVGGYVWHHDTTGAEAYVRIETDKMTIPTFFGNTQEFVTSSLVINDFTYFPKTPQPTVTITLDNQQFQGHAFQVGTLPAKSFKHPQYIVLRMPPKIRSLIEQSQKRELTYYYTDGTAITKTIEIP